MSDAVDRPRGVRSGEELDAGAVGAYLCGAVSGWTCPSPEVRQFPSGFSNLTYLLTDPASGAELVLRRPPHGTKAASAHDMLREYRLLEALAEPFPYVPAARHYCADPEVLGAEFYVMDRLRGVILRRDPPAGLALPPGTVESLARRLLDVQVELHGVDPAAAGLEGLGKPGYVGRQVEGWSRRYRRARTEDAPEAEDVIEWLEAHQPPDRPLPRVIHGDYKLDNVVLDPEDPARIVGVLDWELATVGDPLMDLGCSLAYWVEAGDPAEFETFRTLPTNLPGAPTRRQLAERYFAAAAPDVDLDGFAFYYAFGLFRLAGIAQQIYYRYSRGQTKDPRFGALIHAVRALHAAARRATCDGLG